MSEDFTTPPSDEETRQWVENLSEVEKAELRRQQLQHRAVTRQPPGEIDFGSLSDAELEAFKRKHGFYR
jgi:hypothetical protein